MGYTGGMACNTTAQGQSSSIHSGALQPAQESGEFIPLAHELSHAPKREHTIHHDMGA